MGIIEINNLSKTYGELEHKIYALKNINLNISEGEFVAIMGPSGSGKSTLLNIIGCMDKATEGEYILNGKKIYNLKNRELSKIRNEVVSFIFQHFALMKNYNVYENVELPLTHRNIGSKDKKKIVIETLRKLGIEDQRRKKPSKLSGGQQQRVAIARAIVSNSKIILADEPTGALDQNTGMEVMKILEELNKEGKTIIVITHDPNIAKKCKRVIYIKDGTIE